MKALVVQGPKVAIVQEVLVPVITDDEILVKVVAAAQNPTDWQRTFIMITHTYHIHITH